jgi:hypothetical protein
MQLNPKRRLLCLGLCCALVFVAWIFLRPYLTARALLHAVKAGPGTIVDFAQVAPFAWDRLYIFGPYTSPESMEASLGFNWFGSRLTSLEESKGECVVVFVRGANVVEWFHYSRGNGDLVPISNLQGYAREEAVFEVQEDNERRLLLVKPQK